MNAAMPKTDLRISFGMIVLNGEPFLRYNLEALYPFAHQIIVVEGAALAASGIATPEGHSQDDTLLVLEDFKRNHDPENKLWVVTAENEGYPNGFWPGEKHEQSQAYAKRVTGDYLWQVDVDEFYKPDDMCSVIEMLKNDNSISAVSFKQIAFWGGVDYSVDSYYLRLGGNIFHRLFKWSEGYQYLTHRPPTVLNADLVDTRDIHWISAAELADKGIYLYHYSLLFPKQVQEKCNYYKDADWINKSGYLEWAENSYFHLNRPYNVYIVYDLPGWLEKYYGNHPMKITHLIQAINRGVIAIEQRRTDDIQQLVNSPGYRVGKVILILYFPIWKTLRNLIISTKNSVSKRWMQAHKA